MYITRKRTINALQLLQGKINIYCICRQGVMKASHSDWLELKHFQLVFKVISRPAVCTVEWFVPIQISSCTNFHFCSDHTNISRGTYTTITELETLCFVSSVDPKWPLTHLLRGIYIPSFMFKQLLLLEISCLQDFGTLTSSDLKCYLPNQTCQSYYVLFFRTVHIAITAREVSFLPWESSTPYTTFWKKRTTMDNSRLKHKKLEANINMTSNDFWPPWKTTGIIYSHWTTYVPSSGNFHLLIYRVYK